jgi:hypothetical protein
VITKRRVAVPANSTINNVLAGLSAEWAKADGVCSLAAVNSGAASALRSTLRLTDEIVLDDVQTDIEVAAGRGPSALDNVLLPQQAYAAGDHFILSVSNPTAGALDYAYILDQKDM